MTPEIETPGHGPLCLERGASRSTSGSRPKHWEGGELPLCYRRTPMAMGHVLLAVVLAAASGQESRFAQLRGQLGFGDKSKSSRTTQPINSFGAARAKGWGGTVPTHPAQRARAARSANASATPTDLNSTVVERKRGSLFLAEDLEAADKVFDALFARSDVAQRTQSSVQRLKFNVIVLACARLNLLKQVVDSATRAAPVRHTHVQVWIDRPLNQAQTDHRPSATRTVEYARSVELAYVNSSTVRVVTFMRHMGTRSLWLTALSLREPHLVLEDDVVLLPGAYDFYCWALAAMRHDPYVLGTSFSAQGQIARLSAKAHPSQLKSNGPYLYPLPGSHGFMLSPHAHKAFFRHLRTRADCMLMIDDLRSTGWWRDLLRTTKEPDSMWTQEMVAFAFHNNRSTLYPPQTNPAARHCSNGRASDTTHASCVAHGPRGREGAGPLKYDAQMDVAIFDWGGHPVPNRQAAFDEAWVRRARDTACGRAGQPANEPRVHAAPQGRGNVRATAHRSRPRIPPGTAAGR